MLDLAWSEIALIAVVALVVIGPKDLPEAIRGVARGVQKLRRMAAEFQSHADELVREAKLEEVRNQIHEVRSTFNEIRSFDLRGEVERAMDSDGTLRRTFSEDPLSPTYGPPAPPAAAPAEAAAPPAGPPAVPEPAANAPPAFIPPGAAAPAAAEPVIHPKA
jgi:sec-independent protein translocase protein TatB